MCSVKLDRAQKLIGGLGGERDRWSATAESLEAAYGALTGDALVAATTMSYFGAFTASFRQNSIDVISQSIRMLTKDCVLYGTHLLVDACVLNLKHIDSNQLFHLKWNIANSERTSFQRSTVNRRDRATLSHHCTQCPRTVAKRRVL